MATDALEAGAGGPPASEGTTLDGRYRLGATLGAGGMATVYLATDMRLDRSVVVKMPHTALAAQPGFLARFQHEIASLTRIEHPHVVKVLDTGSFGGLPYAVLQHLSGGSLRDRLDKTGGKQEPAAMLPWLLQVAEALDHIHGKGLVHRDVKPGNILYDDAGNVVLADFGIAKAMGHLDTGITTTGVTPGSPGYMAPEVVKGGELGPRYDQFSLAVCVYEALAGRLPHSGATPLEILTNLLHRSAADLAPLAPGVPPDAVAAVMKSLARDPAARFATCTEFAKSFQQALGVPTMQVFPREFAAAMRRRRWMRVGAVAAVIVAAAAIGWFARPGSPAPQAPLREPSPVSESTPGERDLGEPPWKLVTPPDGPAWVKVSQLQVDEAKKLGVPVAFENSLGMRFVLIPAGTFAMGAANDDLERTEQEEDSHPATVAHAFYLQTQEVTNAHARRWKHEFHTSALGADADGLPACGMSVQAADALVAYVTSSDGRSYRLPSEVEWEYACRAGTSTARFWELHPAETGRFANVCDACALRKHPTWTGDASVDDGWESASPAGSLLPNPWGLFDMIGNASERCRLGDGSSPEQASVSRGGAWDCFPACSRSAYRLVGPNWLAPTTGLRLATDPHSVAVESPEEGATRDEGLVSVSGTTTAKAATVRVNGVAGDVKNGKFDVAITLPPGEQEIEVVAGTLSSIRRVKVTAVPRPADGWPRVPAWAKVSKQQVDEARRLGVDAAFENSLGMRFVLIPAGRFLMGSPESEVGRGSDETPHWVTRTRAVHVMITEVSSAQFRLRDPAFVPQQLAENLPAGGDEQPATCMTCADAAQFADWVSERDPSHRYRLPTEAEWEHACRAGTTTAYFWGTELAAAALYANFADASLREAQPTLAAHATLDDGCASLWPVGSHEPNPWGLFDMAGNAIEFTADGYAPHGTEAVVDPSRPPLGAALVLRGGGFDAPLSWARCAARLTGRFERGSDTGFRLVADLPEER